MGCLQDNYYIRESVLTFGDITIGQCNADLKLDRVKIRTRFYLLNPKSQTLSI